MKERRRKGNQDRLNLSGIESTIRRTRVVLERLLTYLLLVSAGVMTTLCELLPFDNKRAVVLCWYEIVFYSFLSFTYLFLMTSCELLRYGASCGIIRKPQELHIFGSIL